MTTVRPSLSISALLALLFVLPAAAVPTHAGFTAGFSGGVDASGAIDIAQTTTPDGQHATEEDAASLTDNGLPVGLLDPDASAPRVPTATVSMPVVNLSDDALATIHLFVRSRAGDDVLPHLRMSAHLSAEDKDSGLISGSTAADDSAGLDIPGVLDPGAEATVEVSIWLTADAPATAFGSTVDLVFQLVGETVPKKTPTVVEGEWA